MSDHLVELETLTPKLSKAIESRSLKNALGRAAEKLGELPRQAERLNALAKVAIALKASQATGIKTSLREAAEVAHDLGGQLAVASTPESLQGISDEIPDLTVALRNLDNIIRQAWATTVQNEFQALASVGDLLSRISKTENLGRRLRAVGSEAQALVERRPRAEDLSVGILELREKRASLVAELSQLTESPEVDSFINAVTRDAATLADVTPIVMSWLRQNNALEAFTVRGAS